MFKNTSFKKIKNINFFKKEWSHMLFIEAIFGAIFGVIFGLTLCFIQYIIKF